MRKNNIIKMVEYYMLNGFSLEKSIQLTACDYETSTDYITNVYNDYVNSQAIFESIGVRL